MRAVPGKVSVTHKIVVSKTLTRERVAKILDMGVKKFGFKSWFSPLLVNEVSGSHYPILGFYTLLLQNIRLCYIEIQIYH